MTQNGRRPLQGDEDEIFQKYNAELIRVTARRIRTTPDIVEDACAHAWMKFMANQPRRETAFGWLSEVARNEALQLDAAARRRCDDDPFLAAESVADDRDPIAAREILVETEAFLAPLRDRERAALLLRGLGWSYADAAARLGVTVRRLGQIIPRARERVREAEREQRHRAQPNLPPRALLLTELQRDAPPFLRSAIGRPPPASPKKGGAALRLEWSRLALAIVDYRVRHAIVDPAKPFGSIGRDLDDDARGELEQRIVRYRELREHGRAGGRSMER